VCVCVYIYMCVCVCVYLINRGLGLGRTEKKEKERARKEAQNRRVFFSRYSAVNNVFEDALQLLINRYGYIRFAQVPERISNTSFVVLITGNSKSNHVGAQGTLNPRHPMPKCKMNISRHPTLRVKPIKLLRTLLPATSLVVRPLVFEFLFSFAVLSCVFQALKVGVAGQPMLIDGELHQSVRAE